MQRLNGRYARTFNERHNRSGHLFAERYSARVIAAEQHLEQTYAYVEANPAKAGLCDGDKPWPWTWIEARGREDGRHGRIPAPRSGTAGATSRDRLKPVTAPGSLQTVTRASSSIDVRPEATLAMPSSQRVFIPDDIASRSTSSRPAFRTARSASPSFISISWKIPIRPL